MNRPNRRRWLLSLVLAPLLFASCYGPKPVDPSFKANRGQKVAVITMQAPTATIHHVGNQGLIDMAVNHAVNTGGRRQLENYPSQARLDEAGKQFAKRLNEKGYKATHLGVHPSYKEINPATAKPDASKPIPGTGSYLNGYDAAVFLTMPVVGRAQAVYAFIPLSRRNAVASMHGSMFATGDQRRLWRSPLPTIPVGAGVPIEGGDDNPDNVYRAIDTAVKGASNQVQDHFFQGF